MKVNFNKKNAYIIFSLIVAITLAIATIKSSGLVVYNITNSMPLGLYYVVSDKAKEAQKNELVTICPTIREDIVMAINQGYLELIEKGDCWINPLLKRVIATEGDHVLINENGIYVNGDLIRDSKPYEYDRKGNSLHIAYMNRTLNKCEFIVNTDSRYSYDSRYLGVFHCDELRQIVIPTFLTYDNVE